VEKSRSLNVLKIETLQSDEIYEANKKSIIVLRQKKLIEANETTLMF
jgi:hypothetical protein